MAALTRIKQWYNLFFVRMCVLVTRTREKSGPVYALVSFIDTDQWLSCSINCCRKNAEMRRCANKIMNAFIHHSCGRERVYVCVGANVLISFGKCHNCCAVRSNVIYIAVWASRFRKKPTARVGACVTYAWGCRASPNWLGITSDLISPDHLRREEQASATAIRVIASAANKRMIPSGQPADAAVWSW